MARIKDSRKEVKEADFYAGVDAKELAEIAVGGGLRFQAALSELASIFLRRLQGVMLQGKEAGIGLGKDFISEQ